MATFALNKASLHRQSQALQTYRRFLPSLDLKRRQLMAELAQAKDTLTACENQAAVQVSEVGRRLPMLANNEIDLAGLVRVREVKVGEENRLGVRLPVLDEVAFVVRDYGLLAKPHWVDVVAVELQRALQLRLQIEVLRERVQRLEYALRRTTQRVNLFEKVLIPRAKANIQRIGIFLSDAERAAVVRSKIAKRKHARARAGLVEGERP